MHSNRSMLSQFRVSQSYTAIRGDLLAMGQNTQMVPGDLLAMGKTTQMGTPRSFSYGKIQRGTGIRL